MLNKIKTALTGFRKFIIMLIIIAVAVVFRIQELMDGNNVTELLKTVGSAFMAANLVEHVTDVIKKKLEK